MLRQKAGLVLAVLGALALSGCSLIPSYNANTPIRPTPAVSNQETSSNESTAVDQVATSTSGSSASLETVKPTTSSTEPVAPKKTVKTFEITAKNWEFIPGTITVNKGDSVKLIVKSVDVDHGFGLPDFGINRMLKPGATETIEFVADKVGTFNFYCSVYCGGGHREMKGQLIVK